MDAGLIAVENKRTGVTSHMSRAHFEKINADPQWKGVFKAIIVQEPPEVTALKAKQQQGAEKTAVKNQERKITK